MTEPTLVELLRAGHNTQYNCTRAADALDALAARLAKAVATLRETGKPVRELLWCLTVWNDHNFTEADLIRKLMTARKSLGLDGVDRVEKANALLAEIDAVTADSADAAPSAYDGPYRYDGDDSDSAPALAWVPTAIKDCPKCDDPAKCEAQGHCMNWSEIVERPAVSADETQS